MGRRGLNLQRQATPTDPARAILARLIAIEKRLDASDSETRKTFAEHFDMIAELQPKLLPDGTLRLLAMIHDPDKAEQVSVIVRPDQTAAVTEVKGQLSDAGLEKAVAKGNWGDELVKAWKNGSKQAVARQLIDPGLRHNVLLWFCMELQEEGGDLEELERLMDEADPDAVGV